MDNIIKKGSIQMVRKTEFKYFRVNDSYKRFHTDASVVFLTEDGINLLNQLLTNQANKKQKDSTKNIVIPKKILIEIIRMAHHKSSMTLREENLLEEWGNKLG